MARVGIILLLLGFVYASQGRKCWFCQNARSNGECLSKGHLQQCLTNQEYCQNEVRSIGGGVHFEVTKRCKQDIGCTNNKMQNFTGIPPYQCDTEEAHSVCRCCCGFDNCNGPGIVCMEKPPSCSYPDAPINGLVSCPSFLTLGASCLYRCRPGYQLEGPDRTMCEIISTEAVWTNGPPLCVVKPCGGLVSPASGSMSCSDDWNIGSACTFTCDPGRVLVGQQVLKCSIFSIWDGEEPTCPVVECFPPRPLDANFDPPRPVCTAGYKFDSICTFTCHPDYDMVGDDQVSCGLPVGQNKRGTWDRRPPKCQIKTCEPAYPECSGNEIGSSCVFDCERCERMEGDRQIMCARDGWSSLPPVCVIIICPAPPEAPDNGARSCESTANECGNTCTFSCNSGYKLVGSQRIACRDTAEWSSTAPICELAECDPIDRPDIDEQCTNGYTVGSVCTLRCRNEGTEFIGENIVECKKDPTDLRPVWDKELNQYCRDILCPNYPRPNQFPRSDAGSLNCGPQTLRIDNDIDGRSGWKITSKCEISCNDNFQPKDLITETDCTAAGRWTVTPLCCVDCVENTALDVVVLLDRTEEDLWDTRLSFLTDFLDFIVFQYGFNLNITFIPFGADVDYANAIDFLRIDDDENVIELGFLQSRFSGIPSPPAGQDSNSGKALLEVVDNIFSQTGFYNYRVPMIFLLTSNPPSDLALANNAVNKLQDRKIHLRIFPITGELEADPGDARAVLQSLVEDDVYVVENDDGPVGPTDFYILASDRLITVTKRLCNERAQGLQPCLFAP